MIKFKRFGLDFLLAFVPTIVVMLVVFLFFIYPNERLEMSGLSHVDSIYRAYNKNTFWFGIFLSWMASTFVAYLFAVIYDGFRLNFMLPIEVPAKLKSKTIRNYMVPRALMVSTAYELVFELENQEIKQFIVTPEQFSFVFENNKGILSYKEHSKFIYVDFDVQEID